MPWAMRRAAPAYPKPDTAKPWHRLPYAGSREAHASGRTSEPDQREPHRAKELSDSRVAIRRRVRCGSCVVASADENERVTLERKRELREAARIHDLGVFRHRLHHPQCVLSSARSHLPSTLHRPGKLRLRPLSAR